MHDLLQTLSLEQKRRWPEYLPQLVFTYNTTIHQSTGESPDFLMFGQEPQLLIDFLLGRVQEPEGGRMSNWVQEHQRCLEVGARDCRKVATARRKEQHDQNALSLEGRRAGLCPRSYSEGSNKMPPQTKNLTQNHHPQNQCGIRHSKCCFHATRIQTRHVLTEG